MFRHRRKAGTLLGLAALMGGTLALVVGSTTPAFGGTAGSVNYEFDCSTALSPGTVAPFTVTTNLNGAPDPSFPTSALFGSSGAISITLVGPFVGGLAGNGVVAAGSASLGVTITGLQVGPTDGVTTGGPYNYTQTFAKITPASVDAGAASWGLGATVLTVASTAGINPGDGPDAVSGIPNGAAVVSTTATTITISVPTTAAGSVASLPVFQADTFTDAAVTTGTIFTTHGTNGGQAKVGLVGLTGGISINGNLTVPFGTGGAGVGTNNCLETGYQDAAGTLPGPVNSGTGAPGTCPSPPGAGPCPAYPPQAQGGQGALLVAASGGTIAQPGTTIQITPPTAAFVSLGDAAPVASNLAVSLGLDGTKTVTLPTSDTDATPTTACTLVGTSPFGTPARLNVTISNTPSLCQATLTDTGTGVATVTFQFNATDGVTTGNTATVTVTIGTPAVDEPLTQQVNAGQLVLSCNSPESYLQPSTGNPSYPTNAGAPNLTAPTQGAQTAPSASGPGTNAGMTVAGTTGGWTDQSGSVHNLTANAGATTANPQLTCPEFQFPIIQLNGLQQTVAGAGSTLYVSDNRGDPSVGWTLTASFVSTPTGANPGDNPNAACATIIAFCNATTGPGAVISTPTPHQNGLIVPANLSIGSIVCNPHAGNLNPAATAGTGGNFSSTRTVCTATAGQSGGTFDISKTYTLVIPSSVYAGNYWGTVEFLVS